MSNSNFIYNLCHHSQITVLIAFVFKELTTVYEIFIIYKTKLELINISVNVHMLLKIQIKV